MKKNATSYSAALLTLGAAAIHFAAAPEHFSEYLPYGVFFICLGLAQVVLAVAVLFVPSRRIYAFGVAGTAAVIGIWLISRTTGMPIGPKPWRPEEIAFTDLAATLMEAVSCVLFLLRLRRLALRPGRARMVMRTMPALLFVPLLAFGGVGGALSPMPLAYNSAPFIPGVSTTSLAKLVAADGAQPLKEFTLTAGSITVDGQTAWAYNRTVPGPELRVTQGDRVKVILVNHLPVATSIHWHGINVPNAMDGVSGITQDSVPPGGKFVYEFVADEAGTYWYHSHQDTMNQIPKGLIGSIVVEPKGNPAPNVRDYSLLIHSRPASGAIEVNGSSDLRLAALPGDTVRLRITNASVPGFDGAPLTPVLVGAPYVVEALDGHDLNEPQQLGPERIPLGMGQRADLVFTMPQSNSVRLTGLKGTVSFPWDKPSTPSVTIGDGIAPSVNFSSLNTFDLTRYGTPAPDSVADAGQYDVNRTIILNGGIAFRDGSVEPTDAFSGVTSPYVPPINVKLGQLVHLHLVNNDNQKSHPIHIHGHVFSVLGKNGHRLSGSPVHVDAILVAPHETWDVAFRADNPGIWMLHCHVLAHAAAGMSMTINYEGVYSPFAMGTRSGNIPE